MQWLRFRLAFSLVAAILPPAVGRALAAEAHRDFHRPGVAERLPEHPAVGEEAPDFTLRTLEGRPMALGEYLQRGYLIVEFGSATSAEFRKRVPEMERLARDWERLEVKVLLVYAREAHAGKLRKNAPVNYRERVALARRTRKELKIGLPILVDEWNDAVLEAYGSMPNAAYLLDRRGTIVARQAWTNVPALEKLLRRLLKIPEPSSGR